MPGRSRPDRGCRRPPGSGGRARGRPSRPGSCRSWRAAPVSALKMVVSRRSAPPSRAVTAVLGRARGGPASPGRSGGHLRPQPTRTVTWRPGGPQAGTGWSRLGTGGGHGRARPSPPCRGQAQVDEAPRRAVPRPGDADHGGHYRLPRAFRRGCARPCPSPGPPSTGSDKASLTSEAGETQGRRSWSGGRTSSDLEPSRSAPLDTGFARSPAWPLTRRAVAPGGANDPRRPSGSLRSSGQNGRARAAAAGAEEARRPVDGVCPAGEPLSSPVRLGGRDRRWALIFTTDMPDSSGRH